MSRQVTNLKRCGPKGCDSECHQGRACQDALNASRRVFRLKEDPAPAPEDNHAVLFWIAVVFAAFVAAFLQPL